LANGQQVGFSLTGWNAGAIPRPERTLLPFFLDAGGMTFGSPKILDNSWGDSGFTRIQDVIDVTGSTHLPDGTWALVIHETNLFANRKLYLLHIEEAASYWAVKGEILISTSAGGTNSHRQILYNTIN